MIYQAPALRLSTYSTPRIVACAEDFPCRIGLPRGCIEVDLLCAEARLAIELDGAQHLAARMLIGAAAARPGFCRRTRRHLRALGRRP
ncbi:MAG TPA: hypothetical protein VGF29_07770 [Hyphomicrobiaceae bacterium]